jgi:hypothetical protein
MSNDLRDRLSINSSYRSWLELLKTKLRTVQQKTAVAVNSALLHFYWDLGAEIIEKQRFAAWGDGFLVQLSSDLISEFPEMKGKPPANGVLPACYAEIIL